MAWADSDEAAHVLDAVCTKVLRPGAVGAKVPQPVAIGAEVPQPGAFDSKVPLPEAVGHNVPRPCVCGHVDDGKITRPLVGNGGTHNNAARHCNLLQIMARSYDMYTRLRS